MSFLDTEKVFGLMLDSGPGIYVHAKCKKGIRKRKDSYVLVICRCTSKGAISETSVLISTYRESLI